MIKKHVLGLSLLALSGSVAAETLSFTYTLPTKRVDNTSITAADIASCSVFDVTGTSPVLVIKQQPAAGTGTFTTTLTTTKKYAASCTDTKGLTSALSTVASVSPTVVSPPASTSKPKASQISVSVKFSS